MVCIVLWAIDKYIDYKVQKWIDFTYHVYPQGNRSVEHFAPYPSASGTSVQTPSMNSTDLRMGLEPLYGSGRAAAVPLSTQYPAVLPQQQWIQSEQLQQWKDQSTARQSFSDTNIEPQRAVCPPSFHPITSDNVPYTVSLHPEQGDFSHSCDIRPLSADMYPMGMSNGIQQAQELSPQQLATRSTNNALVDQYIQSLDDRSSTRATQDFVPYTAHWGGQ